MEDLEFYYLHSKVEDEIEEMIYELKKCPQDVRTKILGRMLDLIQEELGK